MRSLNIPYINIFRSFINSDISASRLSKMDLFLKNYINNTLSETKNSLLLLLSDHGSLKSKFEALDKVEFEREKYNPFQFLIIPQLVRRKMGLRMYSRLVSAQKKLATIGDTRKLLKCVLYQRFSRESCGDVLLPVMKSRLCCDLNFKSHKNVCICDNIANNRSVNASLEDVLVRETNDYFQTKRHQILKSYRIRLNLKCPDNFSLILFPNKTSLITNVSTTFLLFITCPRPIGHCRAGINKCQPFYPIFYNKTRFCFHN